MINLILSKAFHIVPYNKLLYKLEHYGIEGNTFKWISNFIKQRSHYVVVDGKHSSWSMVTLEDHKEQYLDHYYFSYTWTTFEKSVYSITCKNHFKK